MTRKRKGGLAWKRRDLPDFAYQDAKSLFIFALAQGLKAKEAARRSGWSLVYWSAWSHIDPDLAARWKAAMRPQEPS